MGANLILSPIYKKRFWFFEPFCPNSTSKLTAKSANRTQFFCCKNSIWVSKTQNSDFESVKKVTKQIMKN
jgi:hypothetical protein